MSNDRADKTGVIRVLLADDQDLLRRGLAMMLGMETDIKIVGQASTGEQAVHLATELKPDIILMDIKMPNMNGIAATRAITRALPQTQIVILTTYDTDDLVFGAIRAGAHGYLLKDASENEVLDVVRAVHRGESRMHPSIARKVIDEFARTASLVAQPESEPQMEHLSEREQGLLQLIANGKTNREIAETLFLTEGTVKNYISRIMEKLHANDRTQLAIKALRSGMARLE